MPRLDVTDIILDPDFLTSDLMCVRTTEVINSGGVSVLNEVSSQFAGVVTSDEGDLLDRIEGASRSRGSIMVHTKFKLRESMTGFAADIVVWAGARYTVTRINNYSTYGRGFVAATCDLLPLTETQ